MPDDDLIAAFLSRHDVACPRCGYALRELTSGRCPECGAPVLLSAIVPRRRSWPWITSFGLACLGAGTGMVGWILGFSPSDLFYDFWYEGLFFGFFTMVSPVFALLLLVVHGWFCRLTTRRQWLIASAVVIPSLICYGMFLAAYGDAM